MSSPYIGEVRMVSFNFPPKDWAFCNGQLLPINQYAALFSILGTTYGGNGTTNFALPNLQARIPIHFGASYVLGQASGESSHMLNVSELPSHSHAPNARSSEGTQATPASNTVWSASSSHDQHYSSAAPNTQMSAACIGATGGGLAHENMPPYLTINFVIALWGIFPSQN